MDDKNKNLKRIKRIFQRKSHDEDIPLWLQGLEESAGEETNPIDINNNINDEWVKEISDDAMSGKESPSQEDETQDEDRILPDWLSELIHVDPGVPASSSVKEGMSSDELTEKKRPDLDDLIESEVVSEVEEKLPEEIEGNFEVIQDEEGSIELLEIEEETFEEIKTGQIQDPSIEVLEAIPSDEIPELLDEALEDVVPDEIPEFLDEVLEDVTPDKMPEFLDEALEDVASDEMPEFIDEALEVVIPDEIPEFTDEAVEEMVPDEIPEFLYEALEDVVPDEIPEFTDEAVEEMVPDEIPEFLDEALEDVVPDEIPEFLDEALEEVVPDEIPEFTDEAVDDVVPDEIPEFLDEALEKVVQDEMPESMEDVLEESFIEIPDRSLPESSEETLEDSSLDKFKESDEESFEAFAPEEEFIELSVSDLNDFPDLDQMITDEEISSDEKLPPWLEDLIAEPSKPVFEEMSHPEIEVDEQIDVPTKPVKIKQEEIISDDAFVDEVPAETMESEMISPDTLPEVEIPELIAEIDTTPEVIPEESAAVKEPLELVAEEEPEAAEIPDTLQEAKALLDQGFYSKAVKMINNYIKEPAFLNEIQTWLKESAVEGTHQSCDVWEMIGDIALRQEKPQEALEAYAKAINILLEGGK